MGLSDTPHHVPNVQLYISSAAGRRMVKHQAEPRLDPPVGGPDIRRFRAPLHSDYNIGAHA